MRRNIRLLVPAAAIAALAAAGCSKPENTSITYTPRVINKTGGNGAGGGASIAKPAAAPAGYKTGDLSGGRK